MKRISTLLVMGILLSACNPTGEDPNQVKNVTLDASELSVMPGTSVSGDIESLGTLDQEGEEDDPTSYLQFNSEDDIVFDVSFAIPDDINLEFVNKIQLHTNLLFTEELDVSFALAVNEQEGGTSWTPLATVTPKENWRVNRSTVEFDMSFVEDGFLTVRVSSPTNSFSVDQLQLVLNSKRVDSVDPPTGGGDWWKPEMGTPWHIQYIGDLLIEDKYKVYNIDLFDNSAEFIQSLQAQGKKVICYFSAGSYENWRVDAGDFPSEVVGRRLAGWPGERWLNTRNREALRPIMEARLALAAQKGCDGVDPDNVDGYINNTGFNLSYEDTLLYNRMIAEIAHSYGLAVGLKNDVGQLDDLVDWYDFAVNESCFQYNECDGYRVFTSQGKPVYHIEYNNSTSAFCAQAADSGMDSMQKNRNLDAWASTCF